MHEAEYVCSSGKTSTRYVHMFIYHYWKVSIAIKRSWKLTEGGTYTLMIKTFYYSRAQLDKHRAYLSSG